MDASLSCDSQPPRPKRGENSIYWSALAAEARKAGKVNLRWARRLLKGVSPRPVVTGLLVKPGNHQMVVVNLDAAARYPSRDQLTAPAVWPASRRWQKRYWITARCGVPPKVIRAPREVDCMRDDARLPWELLVGCIADEDAGRA